MIKVAIGLFAVLHGLVHLLYFAMSRKLVDIEPPLTDWPQRSWLLSNVLGDSNIRDLASMLYMLVTGIFVIGGIGILLDVRWGNPILIGAIILSSAIIVLFWNGTLRRLPDQGFIGVLINIGLLGVVIIA